MQDICLDDFLTTKEPYVIRNYTVTGATNTTQCSASVATLFSPTNFSTPRARQPPFPTGDTIVYAVSAYWYTVEFLFLYTPNNTCAAGQCQKSVSEIRDRIDVICGLSWQKLTDAYPNTSKLRSFTWTNLEKCPVDR